MVMDYKGVVHTYWALPFLWAVGVNVFALRISCLFLGLLTMALVYRFARQLYGPRVTAITLLLLALNPSFLFWNRQGVLWSTAMLTCGMGALAALGEWRRRGRAWGLYGGVFLLGLGLSAKLPFLWFALALMAFEALHQVAGRRRRQHLEADPFDLRSCAIALLALVLGLLPLLLYNLQTGGTLDVLLRNLRTSYYGVNNLAYISNLRIRWGHLRTLLNGSSFWYLGGPYRDPVFPLALWISMGVIVAHSLWLTTRPPSMSQSPHLPSGSPAAMLSADVPSLLFPLLMMSLMGLQSVATVSGLWPEHYLLLLPFPQLTIALGLDLLWRHLRPRRPVAWLLPLALALLLAGQLRVDLLYHRALARSGGLSAHSDANYRLAQYLHQKGRPVVAMDWGIRATVQFLTQGQINPVEHFGFEDLDRPGPGFAAEMSAYLEDEDTYYIFHAPMETVYRGRREVFEDLVRQRGRIPDGKRVIYDRSARPLFVVMEADDD
jgi:4-amino-4-deoxy-L-arabinose transferase-like glycosyltransferase